MNRKSLIAGILFLALYIGLMAREGQTVSVSLLGTGVLISMGVCIGFSMGIAFSRIVDMRVARLFRTREGE
jgi:hypothetical protein